MLIGFFEPIDVKENNLVFHGAYAFETFKGQKVVAVYVSIFNNSDEVFKVNSISTDISSKAEIHDVLIENDIVKIDTRTLSGNNTSKIASSNSLIQYMSSSKS